MVYLMNDSKNTWTEEETLCELVNCNDGCGFITLDALPALEALEKAGKVKLHRDEIDDGAILAEINMENFDA